jgi:hypothetical protein
LFIGSGLEKLKFAAQFFCLSLMLITEPRCLSAAFYPTV